MKPLTLQRYFIKGEHSIRSRPSMGAYKNGAHKTIVLKNTFTFKIVHIFTLTEHVLQKITQKTLYNKNEIQTQLHKSEITILTICLYRKH